MGIYLDLLEGLKKHVYIYIFPIDSPKGVSSIGKVEQAQVYLAP